MLISYIHLPKALVYVGIILSIFKFSFCQIISFDKVQFYLEYVQYVYYTVLKLKIQNMVCLSNPLI